MKTFLQISFFLLLITQMSFAQGSWTKVGDMPENRFAHTVDELAGKIYVIGGNDSSMIVSTMDMFDPNTGEWVSKNSMSTYRGLTACASIEGKIYVLGGMNMIGDYAGLSTVEVYNTTN